MPRATHSWIDNTPIAPIVWASDHRVRALNCELSDVTEQMGRHFANILALFAVWWFLSCALWFALSYLCAHASWELFWQICKYGSRMIGVVGAVIGAICFICLVATKGRLFHETHD